MSPINNKQQETRINLPLYNGGYSGDSLALNSFSCFNLYPEQLKGESTSQITLLGTPGLKRLITIGLGPHRGSIVHQGAAYFVSGNTLFKYDTSGIATSLGTLNTSGGKVYMSSNGPSGGQLTITDGTNGYIWNGTTLTVISDVDFPSSPLQNLFIEGYTFVNSSNTDYFQISDFYDSSSWSSLNKARCERDPDNLLAMTIYNRQVWMVGEYTTEIWYNSGNDFPFDHVPNGFIDWGIKAPNSLVNTGNYGILFLGQNRFGNTGVIRTHGYGLYQSPGQNAPGSITPQTILSIWKTYTRLDDAEAFVYQDQGHVFYQITFPTANKTWVYDCTTDAWHQRGSQTKGRHRAASYVFFNGKHIIGDFENGLIYELDLNTYIDDTSPIYREFTTNHLSLTRKQVRHNYLELFGETGVGVLSGGGSNPVVSMSMSDDGGRVYGNTFTVNWGSQGSYKKLARWTSLGISRDRVYKISMSDPIKWRIKELILDFREGSH